MKEILSTQLDELVELKKELDKQLQEKNKNIITSFFNTCKDFIDNDKELLEIIKNNKKRYLDIFICNIEFNVYRRRYVLTLGSVNDDEARHHSIKALEYEIYKYFGDLLTVDTKDLFIYVYIDKNVLWVEIKIDKYNIDECMSFEY